MDITAIVLAGGLGTRLRSVVADVPKPMAPVVDRPFLAYLLDYWITQGVSRFVLSVGYKFEVVVNYFGRAYKGVAIDYVIESTPLGTGGGLLQAVKQSMTSPFLLLNGDTYFEVNLQNLWQQFSHQQADWCFSLFRTQEEGRYMGMNVSETGQVLALHTGNVQGERLANGGVYLVNPKSLAQLNFSITEKLSLEDDIFPAALAAGQRLMGIEFNNTFIDIGLPADYQRSAALLTV